MSQRFENKNLIIKNIILLGRFTENVYFCRPKN